MSVDLAVAGAEWLNERRARGYRLANHDWLVAAFLDHLAVRGVTRITVAEALAFAQERPGTARCWQAARLRVVRGLAAHVHALDPAAAELLPPGLIHARVTRRTPYLYSAGQINALMAGAEALAPPLLGASVATMIGLLAATGLRSGEGTALDVEDVVVDQQLLRVTGKYGRERVVPLHPTTLDALASYQALRAKWAPPTGPLLVGARGGRLNSNTARSAFRTVVNGCGLAPRPGCGPPRLHDLRHTFAVNTLIDAHRQGADVDARIAVLAQVLGHVEPANTYWYLTACPELMAIVSERVSSFRRRLS
ncbi:MAG: tyrosine-type recombinase/integrase [Acidimicrobiales bacterium]